MRAIEIYDEVRVKHKVVASSGEWLYGIGTVSGNYKFNDRLVYKHSKPVTWEITFWEPQNVWDLPLSNDTRRRLKLNRTVLKLVEEEWNEMHRAFSKIKHPFKNLTNWEGLPRAPETEQEVIVLFSKLSNVLRMKIERVGHKFPNAVIMVKENGEWVSRYAEFEFYPSSFEKHRHLREMKKKGVDCDYIICWEDDDWKRCPKKIEVIELKKVLEDIL